MDNKKLFWLCVIFNILLMVNCKTVSKNDQFNEIHARKYNIMRGSDKGINNTADEMTTITDIDTEQPVAATPNIMATDFLLYSHGMFIKGQVLNSTSEKVEYARNPIELLRRLSRIIGLDFDAREKYIYYSEIDKYVSRTKIGGTDQEILLTSNYEDIEGLALDWVSKNLYYTGSNSRTNVGTLNVLQTENPNNRKILLAYLNKPRGVAVHPNKGYVFITEWGEPASIKRLYLDGTNVFVFRIQKTDIVWPNGLSIDYDTDRIYWCDSRLDQVTHANLDGSDIRTLQSQYIKHPFSLVVYKEWLYVTDWNSKAIIRMDKIDGTNDTIFNDGISQLYGIKVFSERSQITDYHNPCSGDSQCEVFCFPVPDNSTGKVRVQCGCPQGQKLNIDNRTCISEPCLSKEFTCSNGLCIPKTRVCDGKDDCLDNSDEQQNCCSDEQFECASGQCIPIIFKCDRYKNCIDNSDEVNCNKTCDLSVSFTCDNDRCLPLSLKCDNENDCSDNLDEVNCKNTTCNATSSFTCDNGRCVHIGLKCDNENDCGDNSDEVNCKITTCTKSSFTCDNNICIPLSWKCDNENDCGDNSDEVNCNKTCDPTSSFTCDNNHCLPLTWKCDNENDCGDNSDEVNCRNTTCDPTSSFTCDNGQCVPISWKCNSKENCDDNSDEGDFCTSTHTQAPENVTLPLE